jgi:hypothetical protein
VRVWSASPQFGFAVTLGAYWDCSIGVVQTTLIDRPAVAAIADSFRPCWRARRAAEGLGVTGAAHMALVVNAAHPSVDQLVPPDRPILRRPTRRWSEIYEPRDGELAGVEREVPRGFGRVRWESEEGTPLIDGRRAAP